MGSLGALSLESPQFMIDSLFLKHVSYLRNDQACLS